MNARINLALAGWLTLVLGIGATLAACGKDSGQTSVTARKVDTSRPASNDEILASVGTTKITVGDLQARLQAETPYVRTRYTSVDQKREFLQAMIRFEILAEEALARGLDKQADVVLATKKVLAGLFIRSKFDAVVSPESITDAEITAYYDGHKDRFVTTEEVRASGLMLKTPALAANMVSLARAPQNASNEAFAKLVDDLSLDALTKQRHGDLRYLTRDATSLPAPVIAAAFGLKTVGDISEPVVTDKGDIWILRLTERKPARQKELTEVKQEIRYIIYDEKRQAVREALVAELRKTAKIDIDQAALATIKLDAKAPSDTPAPAQPIIPGNP